MNPTCQRLSIPMLLSGIVLVILVGIVSPAWSDTSNMPADRGNAIAQATQFDPNADLAFEDAKHEAWYARFWTGNCDGLSFFDFCRSSGL